MKDITDVVPMETSVEAAKTSGWAHNWWNRPGLPNVLFYCMQF